MAATEDDQSYRLESLNPELQREILLHLKCSEDVQNLIKASPRFLQVFGFNKARILCTAARHQFHPAVLPEALTLVKLSQLPKPISRETANKWLKIDPDQLCEWRDSTNSISESVALCKLAQDIRFFAQDMAQNTLPIMYMHGRSQASEIQAQYGTKELSTSFDLSPTEIGRLQRAFCRFEIYRYLFASSFVGLHYDNMRCGRDRYFRPKEQASVYLERFPDFQIAEIQCVRDYLCRRLRGVCTQVENDAVENLSPERLMFDPKGDIEGLEWESGLYVFTYTCKHMQNRHLEHLLSLGLPYLRRLFEAKDEEQSALFIRDDPGVLVTSQMEHDFISEAMKHLGDNPARGDLPLLAKTDPAFEYENDPNKELDIPDVWQWAYPRAPPLVLGDFSSKGLRDWGYVFWDYDRLRDSGIFSRDAEDVEKLDFDEHTPERAPSVQQRLLEKHGLWEKYNRTIDEYSETRRRELGMDMF